MLIVSVFIVLVKVLLHTNEHDAKFIKFTLPHAKVYNYIKLNEKY